MKITRDQIINLIHNRFKDHPHVYALWLEGADSTGTVDEYSDIDFWLDVEDAHVEAVFSDFEQALLTLGPLDNISEAPVPHPKIRHKIFHLENTSEFLKLDTVIQYHSRDPNEVSYVRDDPIEAPLVIFDKAEVIQFTTVDVSLLEKENAAQLVDLQNTFSHAGVRKYAARGEFIEALAMYNRYVLDPLITLLRLQHTPRHPHYGPVHISRHLPVEVVYQLEALHKNASLDDLLRNCHQAERLFTDTFTTLRPDLPV